jgi:PAS domain S-box-containing protein
MGLFVLPVITLVIVWTNDWHHLHWQSVRLNTEIASIPVFEATYGPWFWVHTAYSYLTFLLGSLLLIQSAVSRYSKLYRWQVWMLFLASLVPWFANILTVTDLGLWPGLDLTPFGFALAVPLVALTLSRFGLFDIVPTARDTVVESMSDAVFVIDTANRVVDMNQAAQRALGRPALNIVGQPVTEAFPEWPDLVERYLDVTEMQTELVLDGEGGSYYYDLRISPLHNRRGQFQGRVVVVRDITQGKQMEGKLREHQSHLEKLVAERTAELQQINERLQEEIGERRRTETALRQSEKRYRYIVETAQEGIWIIDVDNVTTFVNPMMAEMLGYREEEMIGASLFEFMDMEFQVTAAVHMKRRRQGIAEKVDFKFQRKDGTDLWALVSATPLFDTSGDYIGALALITDITERKQAEEQLRYQATLLAQVSDAIISTDLDFNIRSWNVAAERMYGWRADEAIGQDAIEFLQTEFKDEARTHVIDELFREGYWRGQVIQKRKDGVALYAFASTSLLKDKAGNAVGVVAIGRDISERKEAEQKLQQYTKRLEFFRKLDQAILAAYSPQDIAKVALNHLRRMVSSQRASVTLFDFETQTVLILVADSDGETELKTGKHLLLDEFPVSDRLRRGSYQLVGDLRDLDEPTAVEAQLLVERIRSYVNVPLFSRDELIGSLNLGRTVPHTVELEHVEILREVAGELAIAIQQAKLHEQVQLHAVDLELRVKERTEALSRANELLSQEIVERKQAEMAAHEQHALAEALRDTTAVLNSTLKLDEVLERILANVGRVVPHDVANVMLVESGIARIFRCQGYSDHGVDEQTLRSRRFVVTEVAAFEQMAQSGQPLAIPDVQRYPGWLQVPELDWLYSYAGAPIHGDGRVIGFLNLDSTTPGFFTQEHAERLGTFADHASIAIRNAQLYGQAQELAALQERQRLARELHDAVSQTLWSATLIADVLPDLWQQDPDRGRERLARLSQLTHGALAEMRALLLELRPSSLVEVGMGELLRQLAEATASRARADVNVAVEGPCLLPSRIQVALYRVAQEALNNVARNGMATQVDVRLCCDSDKIELTIDDNGRGFDPENVPPGHLGLDIMQERARDIGGILNISSRVGQGTRVTVICPPATEGVHA